MTLNFEWQFYKRHENLLFNVAINLRRNRHFDFFLCKENNPEDHIPVYFQIPDKHTYTVKKSVDFTVKYLVSGCQFF